MIDIVRVETQSGLILVYEGQPAYGTLIASSNPHEGYRVDPYGCTVPPGYWCAKGWALHEQAEVWPGTVLERDISPTVIYLPGEQGE